jgi:hypothetical protein
MKPDLKPLPHRSQLLRAVRHALPHIEVDDHPFDIGYWARWAGYEKPSGKEMSDGWKQANRDVADPETFGTVNDGKAKPRKP